MKRPYLLLEVLIAIALVALCAMPLIRPHLAISKRDHQNLQQIQNALLADDAFNQIRLKLYTHEITWGDLQYNRTYTGTLEHPRCTFTVKELEKYKKSDRAHYRLNEIQISLRDAPYTLFSERWKPEARQS